MTSTFITREAWKKGYRESIRERERRRDKEKERNEFRDGLTSVEAKETGETYSTWKDFLPID